MFSIFGAASNSITNNKVFQHVTPSLMIDIDKYIAKQMMSYGSLPFDLEYYDISTHSTK